MKALSIRSDEKLRHCEEPSLAMFRDSDIAMATKQSRKVAWIASLCSQ
jgi:hypothetical protein